jgi:predicted nucleic acid-binding Zn ribbon protein
MKTVREPRRRRRRPRGGHICSEELCERVLDNNQKLQFLFLLLQFSFFSLLLFFRLNEKHGTVGGEL